MELGGGAPTVGGGVLGRVGASRLRRSDIHGRGREPERSKQLQVGRDTSVESKGAGAPGNSRVQSNSLVQFFWACDDVTVLDEDTAILPNERPHHQVKIPFTLPKFGIPGVGLDLLTAVGDAVVDFAAGIGARVVGAGVTLAVGAEVLCCR